MTTEAVGRPKIQWGVIGCGRVASNVFVPGVARSCNGEVRAVGSRSLQRAEAFAAKHGISRAYGSYEALLSDSHVDAVYVALPNSLHAEWSIKAAQQGKHVYCEKPIACSEKEAVLIRDACRTNSVLLMEAFAQRFHPQNQQVKELIRNRHLGRVLQITASMSRSPFPSDDIRMSAELCGGILMDMGCYCINTARYWLESEPLSVFARQVLSEGEVDLRTSALLFFPDDTRLYFDASLGLAEGHYEQGTTIYCEEGTIRIREPFSQPETYRGGVLVDCSLEIEHHSVTNRSTETLRIPAAHQWQLAAEHFAERILSSRPVAFPAEDGVLNMRALDAVVQSARSGRFVEIAQSQRKAKRR